MKPSTAHEDKLGVVREFDRVASEYETNRLSGWYKAHAEEILRHIELPTNGSILDIGCGTGWLLRTLASRHPRTQAVGVDLSPAMVKCAEESNTHLNGNAPTYLEGDWETTDLEALPHAPFHTIVCANAFHYFAEPRTALQRMAAVLKPGGRVLLLERDKADSMLTRIWDLLHRWVIRDHVTFSTASELSELLTTAGFINVRRLRAIRRLFWKGKMYTNVMLIAADKS